MIVQPAVKTEQAPSRPAESSKPGWKKPLYHAACAGCLGAAAWAGANAIGIEPGFLTLGIGFGLEEPDTEAKANMIAFNTLLIMSEGMIVGDWTRRLPLVGTLIGGVIGGEGIAAIFDIDRSARKCIGWGIGTAAVSAMLLHLFTNGGIFGKYEPLFVGFIGSLTAFAISSEESANRAPENNRQLHSLPAQKV
jgi:hypothetical protein